MANPNSPWPMPAPAAAATEYLIDAWQRSVLTWDLLRQRGNQYLEHEKSGNPPVLVFDYEMVVDGRTLPKPANYALARIHPPAGCPVARRQAAPFVVIDPRAGHGPGIGGFKMDSEIGVALERRPPVYFVDLLPASRCRGRPSIGVARPRRSSSRRCNALHPDAEASPSSSATARRGWAVADAGRAAARPVRPDRCWPARRCRTGRACDGKNPMRYSGGLLGGTWLAVAGRRPGRMASSTAPPGEQLREPEPGQHLLGQAVRPVRQRRHRSASASWSSRSWWGGHFLLNKDEMEWIVAEPVRRQQAVARRRSSVDGSSARPAQHHLADHRVRLLGRQHHAAAAGAELDRRPVRRRRRHPRQRADHRLLPAREDRPPGHLRLGRRGEEGDVRDGQCAGIDRHAATGPVRGGDPGHHAGHAGPANTSRGAT